MNKKKIDILLISIFFIVFLISIEYYTLHIPPFFFLLLLFKKRMTIFFFNLLHSILYNSKIYSSTISLLNTQTFIAARLVLAYVNIQAVERQQHNKFAKNFLMSINAKYAKERRWWNLRHLPFILLKSFTIFNGIQLHNYVKPLLQRNVS